MGNSQAVCCCDSTAGPPGGRLVKVFRSDGTMYEACMPTTASGVELPMSHDVQRYLSETAVEGSLTPTTGKLNSDVGTSESTAASRTQSAVDSPQSDLKSVVQAEQTGLAGSPGGEVATPVERPPADDAKAQDEAEVSKVCSVMKKNSRPVGFSMTFFDPSSAESKTFTFNQRPLGIDFSSTLPVRVKKISEQALSAQTDLMVDMELTHINGSSVEGMTVLDIKKTLAPLVSALCDVEEMTLSRRASLGPA